MRLIPLAAAAALAWSAVGLAQEAPKPFALQPGDRVVFYGDSITEQRLYTTYAETFVVTRFPTMPVAFVHSGWGGDRVTGGGGGPIDVRLDRDVVAYRPTVVTVMLGMNDASYRPFDEKIYETYTNGYRHIVEKLKRDLPGVRLTLIQPSPYDDVTREPKFEGGYNGVLTRFGDFVADLAKKEGAGVADLNTSVVEATKKAFSIDPKAAENLNKDRVHPGPGGQLLMAEALLKEWNAPSLVSSVTIDVGADGVKLTGASNAQVSGLSKTGDAIQWTQVDGSLPFPLDLKNAEVALAVQASDVVDALDRQIVQVSGADAGKEYTLKIDGQEVGTFPRAKLAEGVNLATLPTPMRDQAMKVHGLTLRHNNLHYARWRQIQVPYNDMAGPGLNEAIQGLDALETAIIAAQRAAALPTAHTYLLTPKG